MNAGVLCNDVHSRLNAVTVSSIHRPASTDEVAAIVRDAAANGECISICGARHAMGGQQFGERALLIDTTGLTDVSSLDTAGGTVEAGAGIAWPELVAALHALQPDDPAPWTIRQKQTGADELTLGGSLAANIHGRGLAMRPIIDDVEAFTLVDAHGRTLRCDRRQNRELFRLAIGGYGCFGIITSIRLRLARRHALVRSVSVITLDELMPSFDERIRAGASFGDFQFSIDEASGDFLHKGIFSTYLPLPPDADAMDHLQSGETAPWGELIHLAHTDRTKCFDVYAGYYLRTDGKSYASDTHQMSFYQDGYHETLDRNLRASCPGTEMISELYVPRERLAAFMAQAAEALRKTGSIVIYGTIRLITADTESFLPWAARDYACIIFNLHTDHCAEGIDRSKRSFRALIDIALSMGGSYYLTYHRWATREQLLAAHPAFPDFMARKSFHDPHHRFQSEWWRHHHAMIEGPEKIPDE